MFPMRPSNGKLARLLDNMTIYKIQIDIAPFSGIDLADFVQV